MKNNCEIKNDDKIKKITNDDYYFIVIIVK